MKNIDFSKFADKFIDDANNLLNELENKLLELEQNPSDQNLIEAVFRAMHTLKGIGAMFGFNLISDYTHHLENIYDKIRENLCSLDSEIFELTFRSIDHLRNLLSDRELKNLELAAKHTYLLQQLEKTNKSKDILSARNEIKEPVKPLSEAYSWYIQFICSEELITRAVNIEFLFQDLSKIGTYSIFSHSTDFNKSLGKEEMWGIILTTSAPYSEIEAVFMFVMDNVKIIRLASSSEVNDKDNKYSGSINDLSELFANQIELADELEKTETFSKEQTPLTFKTPRISVGADKLDKLMYLVSELFTTRSELILASRNSDMPAIKLGVEKIDRLSALFRKNALNIRLVPLQELTLKFKRLIRDLGKQLSKNIEFEIKGDDTELDKNLVDTLADPLMHILRNCIDHGIETPAERIAANKPEYGTIRFIAYQSSNYIHIKISDDGKGIDKESIRQKAVEKGLVSANAHLSEKEILDLIFLPGLSTAQNLTQVSGRGVGMDVVKRTITNLRGSVDLETEPGKGTSFTIKLQQTIAIMDTLLVKAANSYFTLILEEVELCGLETHSNIHKRQNNHLELAGEVIPYISLREVFSLNGIAPETERIVIIKRESLRFAIITDSIVGQYQAVVKPLGTLLKHKEYLSGASILGNGNIAFMIDSQKLSIIKTQ